MLKGQTWKTVFKKKKFISSYTHFNRNIDQDKMHNALNLFFTFKIK